jgi:hypothetical protein
LDQDYKALPEKDPAYITIIRSKSHSRTTEYVRKQKGGRGCAKLFWQGGGKLEEVKDREGQKEDKRQKGELRGTPCLRESRSGRIGVRADYRKWACSCARPCG